MKICIDCQVEKPLEDFYLTGYVRKDGTQARKSCCKPCDNLRAVKWQAENSEKFKERQRRYHFKSNFGLTPEQYDEMISQGCNVCGTHELLNIDHDHACCPGTTTCGKCVRGVLCRRHNWVLGNLNDSLEEVRAMEKYIIDHCQKA